MNSKLGVGMLIKDKMKFSCSLKSFERIFPLTRHLFPPRMELLVIEVRKHFLHIFQI